jgi:hypothetical protein
MWEERGRKRGCESANPLPPRGPQAAASTCAEIHFDGSDTMQVLAAARLRPVPNNAALSRLRVLSSRSWRNTRWRASVTCDALGLVRQSTNCLSRRGRLIRPLQSARFSTLVRTTSPVTPRLANTAFLSIQTALPCAIRPHEHLHPGTTRSSSERERLRQSSLLPREE